MGKREQIEDEKRVRIKCAGNINAQFSDVFNVKVRPLVIEISQKRKLMNSRKFENI